MTNIEKYAQVFCETFELDPEKLPGLKYQSIEN